jgi:hypothetical protein
MLQRNGSRGAIQNFINSSRCILLNVPSILTKKTQTHGTDPQRNDRNRS